MGAEEERKWEWPGGDIVNQWAVTLVTKPPACPPERAGPCKESRLCDLMEAEVPDISSPVPRLEFALVDSGPSL